MAKLAHVQRVLGLEGVRTDDRIGPHLFLDKGNEGFALGVHDHRRKDLTAPLQQTEYCHIAGSPTASFSLPPATKAALVGLDLTAQLLAGQLTRSQPAQTQKNAPPCWVECPADWLPLVPLHQPQNTQYKRFGYGPCSWPAKEAHHVSATPILDRMLLLILSRQRACSPLAASDGSRCEQAHTLRLFHRTTAELPLQAIPVTMNARACRYCSRAIHSTMGFSSLVCNFLARYDSTP